MSTDLQDLQARLAAYLLGLRDRPLEFLERVLGFTPWSRQAEIAESVAQTPITLGVTSNSSGKTAVASRIALWYSITRPHSQVLVTGPNYETLRSTFWKELQRAHKKARIPLGGTFLESSPARLQLAEGWSIGLLSSNSTEKVSGRHEADLLVIADEASDIAEPIWEGLDSLNASRMLVLGNPLRATGRFRELARKSEDSERIHQVHISAFDGPDIELERSPRGLADKSFLDNSRELYGEDSLWWLTHILAKFPDSTEDSLLVWAWIDLALKAEHVPDPASRWIGIDLAGGGGGDESVIAVTDNNGILELEHSNRWSFEQTAQRAAALRQQWEVPYDRVSYDANGLGHDFGNRLEQQGWPKGSARAYIGSKTGKGRVQKFLNLRSFVHWCLRRRLNPNHDSGPRPQYHIPERFIGLLRPELQGLNYCNGPKGALAVESKEEFKRRLKRSPDLLDALCQRWAFVEL